jgi:alkanesulfonate monooxygenase SsuD/methylene tetrahydromethanopterin reductase-like flavin-dependent oxidoreductase (luciferase family)
MSNLRPLGAAVVPLENRHEAILAAMTTAERLGYDAFFQNEQRTVWGTPAEARARLERWYDAGADAPIVFIRENLSVQQMAYTLEALGPAGRQQAVRPR